MDYCVFDNVILIIVTYPLSNENASLNGFNIFYLQPRVTRKVIPITQVLMGEGSTLWGNVNTSLLKIAVRTSCLQSTRRIGGVVGVVPRVLPL